MDFGIHNNRQSRMSNYINGRNLIFSQQKEAEINAALQRFQLLLYGNYYIQFYCKTINS